MIFEKLKNNLPLLNQKKKFSVEDFCEMQLDLHDLRSIEVLPDLIKVLKEFYRAHYAIIIYFIYRKFTNFTLKATKKRTKDITPKSFEKKMSL